MMTFFQRPENLRLKKEVELVGLTKGVSKQHSIWIVASLLLIIQLLGQIIVWKENIEQKDVKIFQFGEERGIRKFKATDKAAIVVKQMSTNKEKPGSLH